MPIPAETQSSDAISPVMRFASLAPSGDNTQPWRFAYCALEREFSVVLDVSRDRSPMNAGQRMARVAVGAAGESVVVGAAENGCQVEIHSGLNGEKLAIRLDRLPLELVEIPLELTQRVSNRRVYGGQMVDAGELRKWREASFDLPNARVVWLGERGILESMAKLIGQADATMFGMREVRRAFLENVRFDRPAAEAVEEGLSLDSLELAPGEKSGLPMLGKIPDWLFSMGGVARSFRKKSEKLVLSASGMCVIAASNNSDETDFTVGRLMQRAWLELTRRSFAVQPMMSLPVLEGMLFHSHSACGKSLGPRTAELSGDMKQLAGLEDGERIAAILRFGTASPPTGRTGRRPLESSVVSEEG